MQRQNMIDQLRSGHMWDVCIIGGGATGLGIAVDAASRGYQTVLFEKYDFAKGTSSRSTKLVHGGVRYLQQGNIKLVLESLHERGIMMKNAPHLVKNQSFVIPNYEWWEHSFYGLGLKAYDWMAGKLGLGPSEFLSVEQTLSYAPTLDPEGLRGGVLYHDGQFDDARMALSLAMTAADHGAAVINYFDVTGFLKSDQKITGIEVRDTLSDHMYEVNAKVIINAAGVFSHQIQKMDDATTETSIAPSQGIHLVFDKTFLPTDTAIMIPRTEDGRVLFAVPWHQKIIVGTTDTATHHVDIEPVALQEEIDFVLEHMTDYLTAQPTYQDIKSVFCGLRPLVKGNQKSTATLSREHMIEISSSGLVSITGGKWTTYRKMAEDVMKTAIETGNLPSVPSITIDLQIHGYKVDTDFTDPDYYYGSDHTELEKLIEQDPRLGGMIHPALPNRLVEIVYAVNAEMCMTVEDFLARRCRMLFLDAKASLDSAPLVAQIMAAELHKDQVWIEQQLNAFQIVAKNYLP